MIGFNVLPDQEDFKKAAELINIAKRPVLYVGNGVNKSNAFASLKELAEKVT